MKPGAPWAVKLVHEGKEQGLSPEKIRQKLVREGLELEKIDSVLGPSSAAPLSPITAVSATDEPSSPSFLAVTSPQHRQLSSRYAYRGCTALSSTPDVLCGDLSRDR